jgi:hypothetical protein
LGVQYLYLFGLTARGDASEDCDVDLFFDREPGKLGLFQLMDVNECAVEILGCKTDSWRGASCIRPCETGSAPPRLSGVIDAIARIRQDRRRDPRCTRDRLGQTLAGGAGDSDHPAGQPSLHRQHEGPASGNSGAPTSDADLRRRQPGSRPRPDTVRNVGGDVENPRNNRWCDQAVRNPVTSLDDPASTRALQGGIRSRGFQSGFWRLGDASLRTLKCIQEVEPLRPVPLPHSAR